MVYHPWMNIVILSWIYKCHGFQSLNIKKKIHETKLSSSPDASELAQQKYESIQSFSDFNNGKWLSKNPIAFIPKAKSDIAAGIYQQTMDNYESICSTTLDNDLGLLMTETITHKKEIKTRQVRLDKSIDIDIVDGSYSIDSSSLNIPFTGIDESLIKFGIEKCMAISDQERIRVFILYDMDDCFMRLIVCNEERQKLNEKDDFYTDFSSSFANDDDDDDDINRLISKITNENGTSSSSTEDKMDQLLRAMDQRNANIMEDNDNDVTVERSPMTLFSLVSGVWLGDMVIRNHPKILNKPKNKGFGISKLSIQSPGMKDGFAEWDTGVQKIAMTYRWDYDKTVRQRMDVGRSMGIGMSDEMPNISNGNVITNYMARGKKPEERLVSLDVDYGAYIALIIGSVLIKVPRLLSFSKKTGSKQPFYTEFAVFQKRSQKQITPTTNEINIIDEKMDTPELFCSRLTRMYDTDGQLKQCTSSFFSLDRSAI